MKLFNSIFAETSTTTNEFAQWFIDLWNSITYFITNGHFEEGNNTGSSIAGRIIIAIALFIVLYYLNKFIIWLLKKSFKLDRLQDKTLKTARSFIVSIVKATLNIFLVVIVLAVLGFDLSGLSTIISSAIVAIGLSLQSIIANFASGIIIITSKKHLVGDYIEINGVGGTIKDVGILSTAIVTPDNVVIYLPNSTMSSSNVTNYNTMKFRRINLTVSVSYSSDIDSVKKILSYCVNKRTDIVKEMPVTIVIGKLNNSSVDFFVRCYVPTPIYWDTYFSLNEDIFKELVKRNVNIPFNQLDVNLHKGNESVPKISLAAIPEEKKIDPSSLKSPIVSRDDDDDKEIDSLIEKAKAYNLKSKAKKANKKRTLNNTSILDS